jgi:hypothetical protein
MIVSEKHTSLFSPSFIHLYESKLECMSLGGQALSLTSEHLATLKMIVSEKRTSLFCSSFIVLCFRLVKYFRQGQEFHHSGELQPYP